MAHDFASPPLRNNTIDVARGVGIVLVVFGHNWIVAHDKGELFRVIFSFHMPLFFFLSGIFIKDSEAFSSFLRSKADALLKPYFVVLLVIGFVGYLDGKISPLDYLVGVVYAVGSTIAWVPLWFLPHLFVSTILIWVVLNVIIVRERKEYILIGVVILFFGVGHQIMGGRYDFQQYLFSSRIIESNPQGIGLPFSIDLVFITSAYGLLGYLSRSYVRNSTFSPILLVASILVFAALHYFFDETMDLNLRVYGEVVVSTLQAISGIFIVVELSRIFSRVTALGPALANVGVSSLFILIFHASIQSRFFYSSLHFVQNKYLLGVASLVAGVVFPIILLEIFKRNKFLSVWLLPKKSLGSKRSKFACSS